MNNIENRTSIEKSWKQKNYVCVRACACVFDIDYKYMIYNVIVSERVCVRVYIFLTHIFTYNFGTFYISTIYLHCRKELVSCPLEFLFILIILHGGIFFA